MEIVWIIVILAALVTAGLFISHQCGAGMRDMPAENRSVSEQRVARRAERARRRAASGAYASSWGYFGGGDGGGGFDGGGCGGDGGGGASC